MLVNFKLFRIYSSLPLRPIRPSAAFSTDNRLAFWRSKLSMLPLVNLHRNEIETIPERNTKEEIDSLTIHYKKYQDGMTAAHNYPNKILPREISAKVPHYIMVYPFTTTPLGDIQFTNRFAAKSMTVSGMSTSRYNPIPITERLYNRLTIAYIFSNNDHNSNADSAFKWRQRVDDIIDGRNLSQIFVCVKKAYPWNEWLIRNSTQHLAPKFANFGNFLGYFGKIKSDMEASLHLYRPGLITVLLIDPHCNIRWHSVGNPTVEALESLKRAVSSLKQETTFSKNHSGRISFTSRKININ